MSCVRLWTVPLWSVVCGYWILLIRVLLDGTSWSKIERKGFTTFDGTDHRAAVVWLVMLLDVDHVFTRDVTVLSPGLKTSSCSTLYSTLYSTHSLDA